MSKMKNILAGILSIVMIMTAMILPVSIPASASAPADSVTYPISQYESIDDWNNATGLKVYSKRTNSSDTNATDAPIWLADGADVGFSGGKVLADGNPTGANYLRSTIIEALSLADGANGFVYPVKEIAGKRLIGESGAARVGTSFYYAKQVKAPVDKGDGTYTVDTVYTGNTFSLRSIPANNEGLRLAVHHVTMTLTETFNTEDDTLVKSQMLGAHSGGGTHVYSNKDARPVSADSMWLSSLVTDSSFSTAELNAIFTAKTTGLEVSERWMDYRLYHEGGVFTKPRVQLTMNILVDGVPQSFTLTVPFKVDGTVFPNSIPALAIGSTYHVTETAGPAVPTYISDFTVHYNTSEYYQQAAQKLNDEIDALAPYTVDKKEALESILTRYNELPESAQPDVNRISSVTGALQAFEAGKYFYDDFESGVLNWQMAGRISGTGKVVHDNWPQDNPDTPDVDERITADDYQEETNTYSAAAASDAGENNKAFWGIHTDLSGRNNALWLRKSFNQYNMKPTYGNNQTRPSVVAITKDVLPGNAQVTSVSGRMFLSNFNYGGNAYKQTMGVTFKYDSETSWSAIGVTGEGKVQGVSRTSASAGGIGGQGTIEYLDGGNEDLFKSNQWLDFSLDYDFELGCYVFTVSGLRSDNSAKLVKAKLNAGTALLTEVGFVNAAPCAPSFDDISIGLRDNDIPDPVVIPGDMNGDEIVTVKDLISIKKYFAGFTELTDLQKAAADFNGDGELDTLDIVAIRKHILGL